MTRLGVSQPRQRFLGPALAIAALAIVGVTTATTPALAADHDYWGWRDGYWGPVFGYSFAAPPYGYYYPAYGYGPYPAYGLYDGRSYYSYYYGRPDFGYEDSK